MLLKNILTALLLFFCFIAGVNVMAQPRITVFADVGSNNASNGLFIKTTGLAGYQFGMYNVETGFQIDIKSYNKNVISGYKIKASREFFIKNFPIELQGFSVWTPFSDILRESNWGMLFSIKRNHFVTKIGTNFRTFAYTKKAIELYGFGPYTKIHENWNLIYSFSYYLKPIENPWNIGMSVTNIDHFIINQETNPVVNLHALYQVSTPLKLFAEVWYKSAGAFNLNVNYFGFFFRTGIIWEIS